jgi:hypothetical protein
MMFRAPSRKQMVLLFLVAGPMLWPFAMLLTGPHSTASQSVIHGGSLFTYFSLIFIGFGAWWMFAWAPTYWLVTWIPTVLAALASERALHMVCHHYRANYGARTMLSVIACVVCGVISASIFATLQLIALRPQKIAEISTLGQLVLMVAIIGGFLGAIVGVWPRLTPSDSVARCPPVDLLG